MRIEFPRGKHPPRGGFHLPSLTVNRRRCLVRPQKVGLLELAVEGAVGFTRRRRVPLTPV